jgi:hypothetical protein
MHRQRVVSQSMTAQPRSRISNLAAYLVRGGITIPAALILSCSLSCSASPSGETDTPDLSDAGHAATDSAINTSSDSPNGPSDGAAGPTDDGRHEHPEPRDANLDASTTSLGPECDDDNPITNEAMGIDRSLPREIVQFERRNAWGCMHREWHDTRQWDLIAKAGATSPRFVFVTKKGWKRYAVQEGASGNGLEFLAMHRAMLGILRITFPASAPLFAGWKTPPLVATVDDPLPATTSGLKPFNSNMQQALTRLTSQLGTFATDDALGLYVQSQLRWTAADVAARSPDPTTGVHAYFHMRFDDPKSAIRMQRFNRNLESEVFWKVHGFIDGLWTKNRAARGLSDATDATYASAMNHACMHMGRTSWNAGRSTCASP